MVLWSCSGDDSSSGIKTLPTSIAITTNIDDETETRSFSYDETGRLTSATVYGVTYAIGYDNKSRFNVITSAQGSATFTYGSNNKLSSATGVDGDVIPIVWTSNNTLAIDGTTYTYASNNDFSAVGQSQIARGSGKGVFADVRSFDPLIVAFMDTWAPIYASKKVATSYTNLGEQAVVATATVNEDGFPSTYVFVDVATMAITYMQQ